MNVDILLKVLKKADDHQFVNIDKNKLRNCDHDSPDYNAGWDDALSFIKKEVELIYEAKSLESLK